MPLTVTLVPTVPLMGFRLALSMTLKLVVAEKVPSLTTIECGPPELPGTMKLTTKLPLESVLGVGGLVTKTLPSKLTLIFLVALKPLPLTCTLTPEEPD